MSKSTHTRLGLWLPILACAGLMNAACAGCGEPPEDDAGPTPEDDAGPVADAGTDSGPAPDAGPGVDAGPGNDAGPGDDAGPAPACGDTPVLVATTTTGNDAQATGTLSADDDFRGSCGAELYVGADAVVEFTAPAAGRYRFATDASADDLDTVVYARSSCLDDETELVCNDNGLDEVAHSEIFLDLTASETVYVVVDTWAGLDERAFTLDINEVSVSTPVLSNVDAYYNAADNQLAFTATGSDSAEDVAFGQLQLLGAADAVLPIADSTEPMEFPVESALFSDMAWSSGDFTLTFNAPLEAASAGVQKVRLTVVDAYDDASTTLEVTVSATPSVGNGVACDPEGGFSTCVADHSCVTDDVSGDSACAPATAPSLSTATAFVDTGVRALGVSFDATDAEQDATVAEIRLLDDEGGRIQMLDNGGGTIDVPPLISLITVTSAGTSFSGVASSRLHEDIPLMDLHSVELRLHDEAGLESDPTTVVLGTPPVLASGAACDVAGGLNTCPVTELCGSEDKDAPACLAEGSACPGGWSAENLNDHDNGVGAIFSYTGTSAGADNLAGRASCGGGGPQAVFAFTPTATDDWRFEISGTPDGADPLIFVRSECAATQSEYELACNDNINLGLGELNSLVEPGLVQGETVFIFVDGHYEPGFGYDGFAGAFTLTATRLYR
jgi:hypothetical protein